MAQLISARIAASISTRIVSGFATPGGLAAIETPIRSSPSKLQTLVVGAATYPAFQVFDDLLAARVAPSSLWVNLGHTSPTNGRRHPFARYHPMLHSKVYYMEMADGTACAFIGSHNMTSFAMSGLNGEAAVMLEGPADAIQFEEVRRHIDAVQHEAVRYDPALKEGYAWWSKQYFEGLDAEINLPRDWKTIRTILIFATRPQQHPISVGDEIYFEMPEGIQVESLRTEVHLFIFDHLPSTPWDALARLGSARQRFTGMTRGADNAQGNIEVRVKWRIDQAPQPVLQYVASGRHRPNTPPDMQQVSAKITASTVPPLDYAFEREKSGWEPILSPQMRLRPMLEAPNAVALVEARGGERAEGDWRLITGLEPKTGSAVEIDQAALRLARPDSGAFVLVSLRRRSLERDRNSNS
ncbi:hypothetical protein MHZ93_21835 [Roseomonas sp. ACRSG]|nr:hypothetical protein [Roseomonas sp. ACRSG]